MISFGDSDSCPGHPDSREIKKRQTQLDDMCSDIKQLASSRHKRLQESLKLQEFYCKVEEEESWIREKEHIVSSAEVGRGLSHVLSLQQKHQTVEKEINGHEPHFQNTVQIGENLRGGGHYASKPIGTRITTLQEKWKKLNELAAARRVRLEEAVQYQQYYSDANEAESWMSQIEPVVTSKDYGRDENSAQSLLESHERVEAEVKAYNSEIERLKELSHQAFEKSAQSGMERAMSPIASPERYEEVIEEEEIDKEVEYEEEEMKQKEVEQEVMQEVTVPQVKALYSYQGQGLGLTKGEVFYLLKKANKDWWSVRRTSGQEGFVPANYMKEIEPTTLQRKIKRKVVVPVKEKVKKTRIEKVKVPKSKRKTVVQRWSRGATFGRQASGVITRQQDINETYGSLVQAAAERKKRLKDAIRQFKMFRDCDELESWIKEKGVVMSAEEKGTGKEKVEAMHKKFENFCTDLAAKSVQVMEVNNEAEAMIKGGHHEAKSIKHRQQQLNKNWTGLQHLKAEAEKNLDVSQTVQDFHQMCDETKGWLNEKDQALSTDDCGKDLASVQALQRRHQALERELAPVEGKLAKLNKKAQQVMSICPKDTRVVQARQTEISTTWDKLKGKSASRKAALDDALLFQNFLVDARDLLGWAGEMKALLATDELAKDVEGAETLIEQHKERQQEIANKKEKFDNLLSLARKLAANPRNSSEVKEKVKTLSQERDILNEAADQRRRQLKQCLELQLFYRDAEQVDATTANQEAFLANEDLGTSLDSAESLLKKHEEFETTSQPHDDRIRALSDHANKLIHGGHYDSIKIATKRDAVVSRRQKVKQISSARKARLMDSVAWQQFCRDADEVSAWINEKMQVATDESYRDPTNLTGKLQKHQAFEAELTVNRDRVDSVCSAGSKLVKAGHFKSDDMNDRMKEVTDAWQQLSEASAEKGRKLNDANDLQQFLRAIDDENIWISEAEALLSSEDVGNDLPAVQFLLKRHQQLESDYSLHQEQAATLATQGQQLVARGHFEASTIKKKIMEFQDRMTDLENPMATRRLKLEESLRLQKFFRNVEEELQWIREYRPQAASTDYGKTMSQVEKLQKKHTALENEIVAHEGQISEVMKEATELMTSSRFATSTIREKNSELRRAWTELKELSTGRRHMLGDAMEAQKYYSEANEADAWMNEKAGIAASQDYGKDEDTATKYLKKHSILEEDVHSYEKTVEELGQEATKLVSGGHFDCTNITARQAQLDEQLSGLQTLVSSRKQRLEESIKLHQYLRDMKELLSWLEEKKQVAASDDYGKNLDHLEMLQKKFDDFKREVANNTSRYTTVNNFGRKLIAEGHGETVRIHEQQDAMKAAWGTLQDLMANRAKRLAGAYEIHKFNRDARELFDRLQEKEHSIPMDELGRDVASVTALQRKHEAFESEASTLGTQVRDLAGEAMRLSALYPGGNAKSINAKQEEVNMAWETLTVAMQNRKKKLKASLELQKFLSAVRDGISWVHDMDALIQSDEPAKSVSGAEEQISIHNQHKAEIDTRFADIVRLIKSGQRMAQQGHYATAEIHEKISELKSEMQKLNNTWDEHRTHLIAIFEYQTLLKEAKMIDGTSSAHELYLSTEELGSSVDEVDALLKKHETVEKLLETQEKKVSQLCEHGEKLCKGGHFASTEIRERLQALLERRTKIRFGIQARRKKLEECRQLNLFMQDINDVNAWISEKMQIATDETYRDLTNLEGKLQKHQTFEAELISNEQRIQSIAQSGESLIDNSHYASEDIEHMVEAILVRWDELRRALEIRGRGLQEAISLLQFKRQVDEVHAMISERVAVASVKDTGRDLDHCQMLIKKFEDFENDLAVDKGHITQVASFAQKLISKGHSGMEEIKLLVTQLSERWKELVKITEERKELLAGASKVHKFIREADDTKDRISDKGKALASDEFGKDLAGVEALLRKHEELERDLTAIEKKLELLAKEAEHLAREQVQSASKISEKQAELVEQWELLIQKADERKTKLQDSRKLQQFLSNLRDVLTWVQKMKDQITSGELAKNVTEAEDMLKTHQEFKVQIETREENFRSVREFGEKLVSASHYASSEIISRLSGLEDGHASLLVVWKERQDLLTQCYDLEVFIRDAEHIEAWISTQEAFIAGDDYGDSLDSVESLIKKHNDYEKTLDAQEDKINGLDQFGQKLILAHHFKSDVIASRRAAVLQRRIQLRRLSTERKEKLNDSRKLQQFLRDADEVEAWIAEKIQVASDESYRDPTNLQDKIQKHQAFESELTTNEGQVQEVEKVGINLIDAGHFASPKIENRVEAVRINWQGLLNRSADKGQKLQEALQHLLFLRAVEDIELWMVEVEGQLNSEDLGKDLTSVNNLLKKHSLLEADILGHQARIDDVMGQVRVFRDANHFQIAQIEDKGQALVRRFCQLEEPASIRRQLLEDSLRLQEFYRDVEGEFSWIKEKDPIASSDDLGKSLTGVQNLLKKHQGLEAEIQAHEPLIQAVKSTANELITGGHYSSQAIMERSRELQTFWETLKEKTSERSSKLSEALEVQQYYGEANEAEMWMTDRKPLASSRDYGKDEDTAEALLRKHEAIELDIESFSVTVNNLTEKANDMLQRSHFDSANISQKNAMLEDCYSKLQELVGIRKRNLLESKQIHRFNRECDEVEIWISEKHITASSEDTGQDLERVELLQKKFDDFVLDLAASEDRVQVVSRLAGSLISDGHSAKEAIEERHSILLQMWENLKSSMAARKTALARAVEIHTFNRDAAETKSRIQEKDAAASSDDYGKDLASVQALQRKHEGFERDLEALGKKVEIFNREVDRLCKTYPDARQNVRNKGEHVATSWKALVAKTKARRNKLLEAEQLQNFLNEFRDLSSWISDCSAFIMSEEEPKDVTGVEAILERHSVHKAEIDTRENTFKTFHDTSKLLISKGHFASKEISEKLQLLEKQHKDLKDLWLHKKIEYEQHYDMQQFSREAELADAWITSQEGALATDDWMVAASLDDIEELLKGQDDFEKTLSVQDERFTSLHRETKVEENKRKQQEEHAKKLREEEMLRQIKFKEEMEKRRKAEEQQKIEAENLRKSEEEARKRREKEKMDRIKDLEKQRKEEERQKRASRTSVDTPPQLRLPNLPNPELVTEDDFPPPPPDSSYPPTLQKDDFKGSMESPLLQVEQEGALLRKNDLDEGGRRAANRSWKPYYTILSGPLMSFYKDKTDYELGIAAIPDLNVTHGSCEVARDYVKKKHTLRLKLLNGAQYYFAAKEDGEMNTWVTSINQATQKSFIDPYLGDIPVVPDSQPPFDSSKNQPITAWTTSIEKEIPVAVKPMGLTDEGERSKKKGFKLFGRKH